MNVPSISDSHLLSSADSTVGTLEESLEAKATWETWQNSEEQRKAREVARKAKRTQAAERVERKVNLVSPSNSGR